jgi:hypothetical protein
MKWLIVAIYWISLVYTMRQGDLWMWWILVPTFLVLYAWAEELEQEQGPAARVDVSID